MKNSTLAIIVGGIAVTGGVAFFIFRNRSAYNQTAGPLQTTGYGAYGSSYQVSAQPGVQNAGQYRLGVQPLVRADNANQPWYGGDRSFLGQALNFTQDVKSVVDVANSVTQLWDDLEIGSWFDGGADADGDFDFDVGLDDTNTSELFSDDGFKWSDVA